MVTWHDSLVVRIRSFCLVSQCFYSSFICFHTRFLLFWQHDVFCLIVQCCRKTMAYLLHGNIKVLPVRKAIHIIVKQPSRTDKIRPWVVLFVCFPYFITSVYMRMGLKYMFQLNNTSIRFSFTVLQKWFSWTLYICNGKLTSMAALITYMSRIKVISK